MLAKKKWGRTVTRALYPQPRIFLHRWRRRCLAVEDRSKLSAWHQIPRSRRSKRCRKWSAWMSDLPHAFALPPARSARSPKCLSCLLWIFRWRKSKMQMFHASIPSCTSWRKQNESLQSNWILGCSVYINHISTDNIRIPELNCCVLLMILTNVYTSPVFLRKPSN